MRDGWKFRPYKDLSRPGADAEKAAPSLNTRRCESCLAGRAALRFAPRGKAAPYQTSDLLALPATLAEKDDAGSGDGGFCDDDGDKDAVGAHAGV